MINYIKNEIKIKNKSYNEIVGQNKYNIHHLLGRIFKEADQYKDLPRLKYTKYPE
jgi:hypothetical protein